MVEKLDTCGVGRRSQATENDNAGPKCLAQRSRPDDLAIKYAGKRRLDYVRADGVRVASALPLKADIHRKVRHVSKVANNGNVKDNLPRHWNLKIFMRLVGLGNSRSPHEATCPSIALRICYMERK
jgi:hypothetical protein